MGKVAVLVRKTRTILGISKRGDFIGRGAEDSSRIIVRRKRRENER